MYQHHFEMEPVQAPNENLICPVSLELLDDPIQLPCGHTFSRQSIIMHFDAAPVPNCPVCKTTHYGYEPITAPKCFAIDAVVKEYKEKINPKQPEKKPGNWTAKLFTIQNNNSMNQTVIGKLEITNTDQSHKFKTLAITTIDASGSMAGNATKQCQYSLNRMIDLSYNNKQLISNIVIYHDRAKNYTINTNEPMEVYRLEASKLGQDSGGTSFKAAFDEIVKVCTTYASNPTVSSMVITFLTDGEDQVYPKEKRGQLITYLKENIEKVWLKPYTIHAIGFGAAHDSDFMNGLRKIGTTEGCYRYADPLEDTDSLSNKINSVLNVIADSSSVPLTLVPNDQTPPILHQDNGVYWFNLTGYNLSEPLKFQISVNKEEPIELNAELADENDPTVKDAWYGILVDQIASELLMLSNQKEDTLEKQLHCELLEQRSRAIASRLDSTSANYIRLEKLTETLKSIRKNESVNQLKLVDAQFEGKFKTVASVHHDTGCSVPQGSQTSKPSVSFNSYTKKVWETIPKMKIRRFNAKEGSSEFNIVLGKGDNASLEIWIGSNKDTFRNTRDSNGSNPLIILSSIGRKIIRDILPMNIFPINATNDDGYTAVDLAIIYGYWKNAEVLLERGAKPNMDGETLLRTCISNRYYNTAGVLLKYKLAIVTQEMLDNCPTNEGLTWLSARAQTDIPIEKAISKGMYDIVSEKVDSIREVLSWKDYMEILTKPSPEHVAIIDLLLDKKKINPDETLKIVDDGEDGFTWPLFAACEKGQKAIYGVLIKYLTPDVLNRQNHKGTTSLWISACNGHIDIVMDLLNRGANPNIPNFKGDSPLIPCCQKGQSSLVELLLEAGADMGVYNKNRDNPVLICCRTGQAKILDMLLKRLKPDELKTTLTMYAQIDGFPPVLASAELDKVECIKVCVKYGADLEWKTMDDNQIIAGATALHLASFYGRLASLRTLVELGADVISKTRIGGQTALHIAIKQKHIHVVRYLMSLEKGRECLHIQDSDGRLPSFFANVDGNSQILEEFFTNRLALGLGRVLMSEPEIEVRCADTLVKYGRSLGCYEYNDITNIDLGNGATLLAYSLLNGNKYLLESLKRMGADMNKKDDFGVSPAFWEAYLGYNNNPSQDVTMMIENVNAAKKLSIQNKMLINLQPGGPKMIESGQVVNALIKMSDGYGMKVSGMVLATLKASHGVEQSLLGFIDKIKSKKEFPEPDLLQYIIWDAKINVIRRLTQKTDLQPIHLLALYLYTSNYELMKNVNDTLANWSKKTVWHPYITCLYQAITLIEPFVGEVYRGVECVFDPDAYAINNVVEWNGFSMCSSEFRTASELIKRNKGVVFIIQSLTGRKIERYSKNPAEAEVVFVPGTQFRVKAYYKSNIITLGQANIRTSTFKISDKDIERAIKGECIIIELEEIDKSMLAIKNKC